MSEKSYIVDPDKEFQKALSDAVRQVNDLSVPFNNIKKQWFKSNKAIFALKGPGKYAPLGGVNPNQRVGQKTKRQLAEERKIREVGFAYPVLMRHGKLKASLTVEGSQGSIVEKGKTILVLGTNVQSEDGEPYPIFLQAGVRNKFLPRPHVLIGAEQVAGTNKRREIWIGILHAHVAKVLGDLAKKGRTA